MHITDEKCCVSLEIIEGERQERSYLPFPPPAAQQKTNRDLGEEKGREGEVCSRLAVLNLYSSHTLSHQGKMLPAHTRVQGISVMDLREGLSKHGGHLLGKT